MQISARHFISPLTAVITLSAGLALVVVIDKFSSVFGTPAQDAHRSNAASTEPERPPEPREFSCYDPAILPIWKELRQDEAFKKQTYVLSGKHDCSSMLEIRSIDLNNDGRREYLVRGKSFEVCSVEGCGFWIFGGSPGAFRILLSSTDYIEKAELGEQVMRSRTGAYSDILSRTFLTDATTRYVTHTFDGKKYVEARCVYENPKEDHRTEGSWEFTPCREFDGPPGL